jgi:hypothetical protein
VCRGKIAQGNYAKPRHRPALSTTDVALTEAPCISVMDRALTAPKMPRERPVAYERESGLPPVSDYKGQVTDSASAKEAGEMNQTQTSGMASSIDEHRFKILAGSALGLLAVGTVVYRLLEDWSWVDSMYFSVVAVTTVGFGDLTPSTDASKLFTIVYILSGITIITTFLRLRMSRRGSRMAQNRAA